MKIEGIFKIKMRKKKKLSETLSGAEKSVMAIMLVCQCLPVHFFFFSINIHYKYIYNIKSVPTY